MPLTEADTFENVSVKLAEMGGEGLVKVFEDFDGHMQRGWSQGECSKAPMIKPEMGELSFQTMTAR